MLARRLSTKSNSCASSAFTALEELGQTGGRTLYQLAVSGEQALDALETLRGAFQSTGLWPMVLGLDEPFADHLVDAFKLTEAEAARALKEAEAIDVDAWFETRREELGVGDPDDLGTWPKGVKPWLSVIEALYREPGVLKPTVNVLLVPRVVQRRVKPQIRSDATALIIGRQAVAKVLPCFLLGR